MSYGNNYSYKPYERASKIGHTAIVNNIEVQNFLSKCQIPPYQESINEDDIHDYTLGALESNPIKNIITVDSGCQDIQIKDDFPSARVACINFGALIFKMQDLFDLRRKAFIFPEDIAKLNNIQRIPLCIPTKSVILKGEEDFVTSVRKTIHLFFSSQPEKNGLNDTLKWLLFEEYRTPASDVTQVIACPNCRHRVEFQQTDIMPGYKMDCPACGKEIFLTDILRLHELMDEEAGATGILTNLSMAIEHFIIVYLIKQILNIKPLLLAQTLFIKDGPLAFFGQTANMSVSMRKLIRFLNEKYKIYLVGLEKSGSFVDHAVHVSDKLKPRQLLLLGNKYIYKYILPRNVRIDRPYASTSYYGNKLIFKSEYNDIYVATIPSLGAKLEPEIEDYINATTILHNITALRCNLYYNSLIPVALANKLVSLSDRPSAVILREFLRDRLAD